MVADHPRILLIGYGNPGRLDDGLGPALAEAIDALHLAGVTVESNYQLSVEDAAQVAEHAVTLFVDAAVDGPEPFSFYPIEPEPAVSFSSHSVSPPAVLGLARDLFAGNGRGYMLAVRGYEYNEFGERLSGRARANLAAALSFVTQLFDQDLEQWSYLETTGAKA